jgi:hypothetical protein
LVDIINCGYYILHVKMYLKRFLHTLIISVLALNLMGAWAFASLLDCGMVCCQSGDRAGVVSYEAPSCCEMGDITCGFETGRYDELFDTAICCHSGVQKIAGEWDRTVDSGIFFPSPTLRFPPSEVNTPPPKTAPVYLTNASFLC